MATLLSPRDDVTFSDSYIFAAGDIAFDWTDMDNAPQPVDSIWTARVRGTAHLGTPDESGQSVPTASYVRGVSLSGVVQMLHLERKTCVIEVTSGDRIGTLTLVNGEVVDAETGDQTGETAVYQILVWPEPLTTILEGVSLFRHTVGLSISHLLIEAVRREDEHTSSDRSPAASRKVPVNHTRYLGDHVVDTPKTTDWAWLAETLIISGASAAAVVRGSDNRILALADESGAMVTDLRRTRLQLVEGVAHAARDWLAQVQTTVDELIVRSGDLKVLVAPLDAGRKVFVYATLDDDHQIDLVRGAIKTISR